MANQIVVSAGAKVRNLSGVLTATSGVVSFLPIDVSLGIPQLDVNGKILVSQLPNSVMEYKGTWDAATNTPTLANGTGNQGDVYLCNVAGTVNFGAGPIAFFVGDQVIYSGSIWQRASGATGTVTSVAVTETGDSLNITGSPITTSGTINIGFNGTNLQYVNGAGNLTTFPILTGYVTAVSGTAPVVSSGGTTPAISMAAATNSVDGYLLATDFAIFSAKQSALTFSSPLVNTSGTISIPAATTSVNGYLASADFTTFNNKQGTITLTTTGTSGAATFSANTLNIPQYQGVLTNPVTGTGTTNYLPKFTSASTIGDSIMSESGSTISVAKNQNAATSLQITNTTSGTSAESSLVLVSNSGASCAIGKYSTAITTYKILTASCGYLYNAVAGDISILNDYASGAIKMAAGGSSTAHFTIASTGAATFSSTIECVKRAFVTGASTIAAYTTYTSAGSNTAYLGVDNSAGTEFIAGGSAYAVNIIGVSAYPMIFGTNNTERMRITSGGNVLIGTTTDAGYLLDVNGTGRFSGALSGTSAVFSSSVTAGNGAGFILNYNVNISSRSWSILNDQVLFGDFQIQQSTTQTGTARTTKFYISPSGNIGIGNSNDTYKLDVSGTANFTGALSGTSASFSSSVTAGGDVIFGTGAAMTLSNVGSNLYIKNFNSNYDIGFWVRPSGNMTQAMTLFGDGNLLLTNSTVTNAGYKLDVNGTGRFSGSLTVTGAYNVPSTSYFQGNATYGYRFNNAADTVNLFILADSGAATFSNTGTFGGRVQSSGGGNSTTDGGFKINYYSNASSRSYLLLNDVTAYGDFGVYQSTTQTGTIYSPLLYFTLAGAATFSDLAGTGTRVVEASSAGLLSATKILDEGTYTPTKSGGSGSWTSFTMGLANWTRIGNRVTVWGNIDATSVSGVSTQDFYITIPITSTNSTGGLLIGNDLVIGGIINNGNMQGFQWSTTQFYIVLQSDGTYSHQFTYTYTYLI